MGSARSGSGAVVKRYGVRPRDRMPNGYVHACYTEEEIDLLAVYCGDLDRCYLLPSALVASAQRDLAARYAIAKWRSELALTLRQNLSSKGL